MREFAGWVDSLAARHSWLPAALLQRYARAYGSRITQLLDGAASLADLGEEILPGLHAAEVNYLVRQEWACSAEDILWRRSKCGLHLPPGAAAQLAAWLALTHPERQ